MVLADFFTPQVLELELAGWSGHWTAGGHHDGGIAALVRFGRGCQEVASGSEYRDSDMRAGSIQETASE